MDQHLVYTKIKSITFRVHYIKINFYVAKWIHTSDIIVSKNTFNLLFYIPCQFNLIWKSLNFEQILIQVYQTLKYIFYTIMFII